MRIASDLQMAKARRPCERPYDTYCRGQQSMTEAYASERKAAVTGRAIANGAKRARPRKSTPSEW